jgi:septum formation protein
MNKGICLILASASPRRRQLLVSAGIPFEVIVPTIHEPDEIVTRLPPVQQAESLAYFKARAVWDQHPDRWVLGADTIVAVGEKVLGKPDDEADARRMLTTLSGTRHEVITGVALLGSDGKRFIASDTTRVTMRPLTAEDVDAYIASGEWVGKAGAYAIQETADRFILKVDGSVSNVVGLPLELVTRMIAEACHQ